MSNIFKKAISLTLVIAMVLSCAVFVHAEVPEAANPDMIPIRMAFESAGGDVHFSNAERTITANHNGNTFIFHPGSQEAYRNGEAFELIHPVTLSGGVSRILYDDIAFLFDGGSDMFAATKRAAVTGAFQFAEAAGIPGITIALVHHESGYTWTQGIGWADTAGNRYVDETTLFDVGSITKLFTAISIMQLVEQGVIDLDEPITTYLPEFSVLPHPVYGGDYRNITTRMLLSHVSGLPVDIFGDMGSWEVRYNGFMNNFLPRLAEMHMDMPELHRLSYANNAYTLMGVLVATLAGYEDAVYGFSSFVRENILEPSGMGHSKFEVTMDSNIAHAYFMRGMPFPPYILYANPIGAGGLYASAYDMARFMHLVLAGGSHDGNQILSEEYMQQMLTVQDFDFSLSPNMQFGLGFYRTTLPGGFETFGHGGGWSGFISDMHLDLDNGLGVFISTNSMTGGAAVLPLAITILATAGFELTGNLPNIEPLPPGVETELPREELERLTGFYTTIGHINIDDGSLGIEGALYAANVPGVPFPLVFTPYTDGSFGTILGVRFWFEEIDGTMVIIQGSPLFGGHATSLVAERIDELWQADEDFSRWIGAYGHVSELDYPYYGFSAIPSFILDVDSLGYAYIQIGSHPELAALGGSTPPMPIIRIDDYTFFIAGTGRNLGMVFRLSEGDGYALMEIAGNRYIRG